jgi:hypothetical protein
MDTKAMTLTWSRLALAAVGLYLALVAIGLATQSRRSSATFQTYPANFDQSEGAGAMRKNYASTKQMSPVPAGQPLGNTQKYEKIASLTQRSTKFDDDKAALDGAIAVHLGVVQLERGSGLAGQRVLHLGIGVPADKFDAFITTARSIGKTVMITTVKNDKTNDYLQLRAKRATLEKTRAALEGLQGVGGSIDERINVQQRLTEIEDKIQELGVSLGDFDGQNELCTVRLTLEEAKPLVQASMLSVLAAALQWATLVYIGIAAGFAVLVVAGWLALLLFDAIRKTVAK